MPYGIPLNLWAEDESLPTGLGSSSHSSQKIGQPHKWLIMSAHVWEQEVIPETLLLFMSAGLSQLTSNDYAHWWLAALPQLSSSGIRSSCLCCPYLNVLPKNKPSMIIHTMLCHRGCRIINHSLFNC